MFEGFLLKNSILSDGQPYAVVAGRGEKGKSARWVYQLSKDEMTTTPERVIHISKAEELPNSYMNELLDSGITRFVIFDDASYTATEIRGGFMTKLNYAFSSKPRLQGQKLEIVVVAPYVTKYAEEQMTSYAAEKGIILKLLKTEYMPEVKDYLTPEQLVTWGGNRKGRTLIYFDHKVPDWLSFDSRINNLVIAKEPMPPYKWAEEKYNPLLKDTVYAKSEQLYWEDFTSRYGGPEAYANLL